MVFSISHDQRDLRVHGHFTVIKGGEWTYHRCSIKSYNILTNKGDLLIGHNVAWNILQTYLPIHLAIIKDALVCLPEPTTLSFSARSISLDEGSQADQGQRDGGFKKPRRSASSMQNDRISELVEELRKQKEEAKEEKERIEQQMERQRKQTEQLILLLGQKSGSH